MLHVYLLSFSSKAFPIACTCIVRYFPSPTHSQYVQQGAGEVRLRFTDSAELWQSRDYGHTIFMRLESEWTSLLQFLHSPLNIYLVYVIHVLYLYMYIMYVIHVPIHVHVYIMYGHTTQWKWDKYMFRVQLHSYLYTYTCQRYAQYISHVSTQAECSLVPRPHPQRGKGSGDFKSG